MFHSKSSLLPWASTCQNSSLTERRCLGICEKIVEFLIIKCIKSSKNSSLKIRGMKEVEWNRRTLLNSNKPKNDHLHIHKAAYSLTETLWPPRICACNLYYCFENQKKQNHYHKKEKRLNSKNTFESSNMASIFGWPSLFKSKSTTQLSILPTQRRKSAFCESNSSGGNSTMIIWKNSRFAIKKSENISRFHLAQI